MEQMYAAPWQWKHIGKDVRIFDYCTILKPELISIGDYSRIDDHCKLEAGEGLTIGARVHIAFSVHLNSGGGTCVIGDHAGIATGARILSGQPDLSYLCICPNEAPEDIHPLRYTTTIGEYALVGAMAVIMPGVTLGVGAVAAAGAVVTKNIPDFEMWAGNPAHLIRRRELIVRN